MSGGRFDLPSPLALLLILLLGSVTATWLSTCAFTRIVRRRKRDSGTVSPLRFLAALATAAMIAMYTWGALHLLMDETAADQACKAAVGRALAGHVDRYEWSFVPLRFGCHVAGGHTYEAAVPGYINPAVLALALLAVILAASAALASSGRNASETSFKGRQS